MKRLKEKQRSILPDMLNSPTSVWEASVWAAHTVVP